MTWHSPPVLGLARERRVPAQFPPCEDQASITGTPCPENSHVAGRLRTWRWHRREPVWKPRLDSTNLSCGPALVDHRPEWLELRPDYAAPAESPRGEIRFVVPRDSAGVLSGTLSLLVLGTEFIIFQTYQDLTFFNVVSFFHADPRDSAGHFGIQIDLVVSHDVAAGGKDHAADIATLGRGANHVDLRRIVRQQAVGSGYHTQQNEDSDSDKDVP